jgi:hypothetical protein
MEKEDARSSGHSFGTTPKSKHQNDISKRQRYMRQKEIEESNERWETKRSLP